MHRELERLYFGTYDAKVYSGKLGIPQTEEAAVLLLSAGYEKIYTRCTDKKDGRGRFASCVNDLINLLLFLMEFDVTFR